MSTGLGKVLVFTVFIVFTQLEPEESTCSVLLTVHSTYISTYYTQVSGLAQATGEVLTSAASTRKPVVDRYTVQAKRMDGGIGPELL